MENKVSAARMQSKKGDALYRRASPSCRKAAIHPLGGALIKSREFRRLRAATRALPSTCELFEKSSTKNFSLAAGAL